MGLGDVAESIKRNNYDVVSYATFGHLAPKKNTTYRGEIKVAVSNYDDLNPTILDIEMNGLEDSPWLYDSIKELLWKIGSDTLIGGNVYYINATFRNYRWWTKIIEKKIN